MLQCEGYKMFKGTAVVTPKSSEINPFKVGGVWLYKPEWRCWYVNGHSYAEDIVSDIIEK